MPWYSHFHLSPLVFIFPAHKTLDFSAAETAALNIPVTIREVLFLRKLN
jgi:hypothetical protein